MLKNKLGKITSAIFLWITSIRYTIKLNNVELVNDGEWLLIFPNHPALIDPIILTWVLWKYILFSPVISKGYSSLPILSSIFSYFWTEYIDNLWSQESLQKNIIALKNKLLQKENILLYPSWSIYSKWAESILGKRMAYLMVSERVHSKIIWVKIEGLWWSIWSKSVTGNTPNIGKNLLLWLYYTIANGIFFVPKREIIISFHDITNDVESWSKKDKTSFNKNLTSFYNKNATKEEYVSHYFYYNNTNLIRANKISNLSPENKEDTLHLNENNICNLWFWFVEAKRSEVRKSLRLQRLLQLLCWNFGKVTRKKWQKLYPLEKKCKKNFTKRNKTCNPVFKNKWKLA